MTDDSKFKMAPEQGFGQTVRTITLRYNGDGFQWQFHNGKPAVDSPIFKTSEEARNWIGAANVVELIPE